MYATDYNVKFSLYYIADFKYSYFPLTDTLQREHS